MQNPFPVSHNKKVRGSRRFAREKVLQILCATEMSHTPWQEIFHHVFNRDFNIEDIQPEQGKLLTPAQIQELESDTAVQWQESELNFAKDLILYTIQHAGSSDQMIDRLAQNWELERIAVVDRVLMRMAVAELISFPDIPPKVTINEAIEIAKKYSTDNSGTFINGVLDAALEELKSSNQLQKSGRGLLDTNTSPDEE